MQQAGWDTQLNVMNPHYELMYVLPGSLELEQVPAAKAHVAAFLNGVSATVTSEFDMERRRLAYKIGQESYGYYHIVQFDAPAPAVRDLDTKLRLDNEVLHYILVKARPLTAEQLKVMVTGEKYARLRPQKAPVEVAVKPAEKMSSTALTEAELAFANAAGKRPVEADAEDKKVSIEELDKKLDAILEDTDLSSKL